VGFSRFQCPKFVHVHREHDSETFFVWLPNESKKSPCW
jgi:hypothetical protein